MWGGGAEAGAARRAPRLVAVAALLIVAALIVWVQYSRLGQSPAVRPVRADDPPSGVPVFYVRDGARPHTIVAYDWSGARRGSLDFPVWVDTSKLRPAPDGYGFVLDPAFPGDYAAYFDRLGYTRSETDDQSLNAQTWAADDTNVCVLSTNGAEATIATRSPNGLDRAVRISGVDLTLGAFAFDACNLATGVAVLQVPVDANLWRLTTVNLASGAATGFTPPGGRAVVSHDAGYIAIGQEIYRASDLGTPIGRIGEPMVPLAFSGDDALMLTIAGTHLVVVDWTTGRQVWTYEAGSTEIGPWVAQPRGGDFAVAVGQGDGSRPDIVIAGRDGKTTTVSSRDPVAW